MSRFMRQWKLLLPLGVIAVFASVVISSSLAATKAKEVRVAIMTDCKGGFGFGYEPDIGGAQAAFAQYAGGKVKNPKKPSAGMTGLRVGTTPVKIVGYGCGDDTVPTAVKETRRLMEQLGADVMIGPLSGDEAVYIANYAKSHPTKTFIIGTAGSQDPTLQIHPNNDPRAERRRKTTLFNLVAGDFQPSAGTIEVMGRDVTHLPARVRPKLGLARTYQKTRLFPGLTVEGNIFLAIVGHDGGRLRVFTHKRDRLVRERARAAAERVLLGDKLDTFVRDLSHGEQRQLEIGLAIAAEPRLMLLDEPAAGLSRAERQLLTQLLVTLERRRDPGPHRARHGRCADRRRARHHHAQREHRGGGIAGRDPRRSARARHLPGRTQCRLRRFLEIRDLNAYYSRAHVLHGLTCTIGAGATAILGRNGMGKTTLCRALMGITPPQAGGSVQFAGRELIGQAPSTVSAAPEWDTCRRDGGSSGR